MADSVNKIKISNRDYHMSPSPAGTLDTTEGTGYVSGDSLTAESWTIVPLISKSDTNKTIFSGLTTMVKNIRYLYNQIEGVSDRLDNI